MEIMSEDRPDLFASWLDAKLTGLTEGLARVRGPPSCKVTAQRCWPHTANPHLLVSKESALHHGPVNTAYLTSLRGLPATLDRLRIDCQLAEAIATGFDPLNLAEVFGISEHTAIATRSTPGN